MNSADFGSTTALVDLELKRLEEARREQGWTPWILLAALGALGWQLAEYIVGPHDWAGVGLLWGILVVAGLTVEGIIAGLNSGNAPARPGIRYFRFNLFSAGRAARLFAAMKIGAAAGLICWLTPFSGLIKFLWLVLFGYYVYLLFSHFVGSWTDFPLPVGKNASEPRGAWAIMVGFWVLHLVLVILTLTRLWPRLIESYAVADARLALLGFAVVYLTSLLLGYRSNEPLRKELIYLRRLIGLGEIDPPQARQALFELIYGSELSVLLRSRFETAQKSLAAFEASFSEIEPVVMAAVESPQPSPDRIERLRHLEELFNRADIDWTNVQMRVLGCRLVGSLADDVRIPHAELERQAKAAKKKIKDLRAMSKNFPADQTA